MILGDLDKDGVPEVLPDGHRIIGGLNKDKLQLQAKNRKTGRTVFSKPYEENPLKKK